ncbi:MAG: hypothetical protein H6659_18245 [Ardenticatenaceae bacterium]|nr:hypothetical protein [Anaerolineales bacterium]MCB8985775.1 hypothetical protein [Ardenticatenaceae bacterium]MCB8988190.1 hypothetical protein [Ardenticatenaceae bacterium]
MTTKNQRRRGQQFGSLKVAVAAGSLAAALMGTQLLARQDAAAATAVAQPDTLTINVPSDMPTTLQTNQAAPAVNSTTPQRQVTLNLQPIPQATVPQIRSAPSIVRMAPLTQTRSSR